MCCKAGGVAQGVKVPLEEKRGAKLRLHLARVTCLAPMTVDRGHAVEPSVCSVCTGHVLSQKMLWYSVTS